MSNRNLTYEINRSECVGDSLGKHNFNFLALDSVLCNLSSLFLSTTNDNVPLFSTFYDLSVNKKIYDDNLPQMLDPYRFEITHNGVSLLSSYWMKQELTAEYEYNKSSVGGIVADTFININTKTFISEITSRGMDYIKENYPVENFIDKAKLNLIVPIYANDGSIIKKFGYDVFDGTVVNRVTSLDLPIFENIETSKYNEEYRKIFGYFFKNDSNFEIVPIMNYQKINDNWTFMKILSSKCDPIKTIEFSETNVIQSYNVVNTQSRQVSLGPCSPIIFGVLYNRDVFGSAIAIANGSANKFGTLSVTFKKSDTDSIVYTWNASNNNYVDVYMEWDDNEIIASNGSPSAKKIFKRWPMPYKNTKNIYFMFTKDNAAESYSVCASKRVFANR